MKALVVGAGGQLGHALMANVPDGVTAVGLTRAELDVCDGGGVDAAIDLHRPALVINAAAYTAVDKAEAEPEAAWALNAHAVGTLAHAATRVGARFVHVSTDFVFDGTRATPYPVNAAVGASGIYGASKAAGEAAARAAAPAALIVRTAWVYAARGANFVATMLRLMRERPEVRVVADQIGTPTHADGLARALWALAGAGATGTHHWTDAGVASWYDFAVAIQEEALALGLLTHAVPVVPIATRDYPTPARRPAYSVLDKSSAWAVVGAAQHWRVGLRHTLQQMLVEV